MGFMESQIEARARYDAESVERTYAELAASVMDARHAPAFHVDDLEQADGAVRTCLRYCGITAPNDVPEEVGSFEERIEYLCRPSGTMHRTVELSEGWYKQAFGAMLGRLTNGETVALLPSGVRGYCFHEPVTGRKRRVTKEIASELEDEAVLFYRPLPAKPLTVRDLAVFIFRIFDRNDYLLVLAAALAATLIGLIPAQVNNIAFGTVVPSGESSLVAPLAMLLLGVAVSTALIGACRNLVMARVSTKLDVVTEAATFARLISLPTSFFRQYASGDLGSRVSTITMLAQTIASVLLGAGLSALLSLVYVLQIGAYAPALAMPALAIIVTQAVLTAAVTVVTVRYERATMEAAAKLSGTVTALLNGIQKLKLAGAEDRAFAKWGSGYAEYARNAYNRPTILRALPALVAFVGLVGNIAIFYLAGVSKVSVADYMSFNVAYGLVNGAIMGLAQVASQIAQVRPMFHMVAPILEAVPEVADDRPVVTELGGGLEVSGVSFRYDEDLPYVLKNLSFRVRSGEYVALVGKSGCGKSTILRLLLGFEKPERGSVFYGTYDVQKVDLRSLRQHIGVVMQDGKLFMGDIFSNITISTPAATVEDAWEAAEIAGIADDIRKMPMGMQTLMTEGSGGVSGGQRQRIMIARAICGSRRILMFDEATSALDNKTQRHVSDSLDKLKCTRIVVAHRLSTIRNCDRILVVDDGSIAEEGTYDELIAKGGLFAELVERQRLETEC